MTTYYYTSRIINHNITTNQFIAIEISNNDFFLFLTCVYFICKVAYNRIGQYR